MSNPFETCAQELTELVRLADAGKHDQLAHLIALARDEAQRLTRHQTPKLKLADIHPKGSGH